MIPTKLKPNSRLILLIAGLALFALLAEGAGHFVFENTELGVYVGLLGALVFLLSVIDLAISWLPARIQVTRHLPNSLSLGKWERVDLELKSSVSYAYRIAFKDNVPNGFEVDNSELAIALEPEKVSKISYRVKPLTRGAFSFLNCHIQRHSTFKLWCLNYTLETPSEVKVYPNFSAVAGYSLLHTDNQTTQLGIKKKVRRGEGMDFLQLREYREGDSLRQIDWKASSRYQKLISQEYQDARDQQVMVMLDSGRRMRTKDDELSHFDHSLNATLMLAHIALKQGDSVSVYSFGGEDRFVAPFKGARNVQRLLNEMYDLYPSNDASDYLEAAKAVTTLNRKRSLIVIATNLRDEDLDDLLMAIKLLQQKHLVLVANLREEVLDQAMQSPIVDFESAARYAGVHRYTQKSDQAIERLKSQGIGYITCRPDELSIRIVNSYLQIKNSGAL